ncbi:MAG: hypothetical protein AAGF47_05025 [Planctomycetota bacterium]
MTLYYCGIDEAGYGPMLGPLCVGRCVVRVEGHDPAANVPDLWERLSGRVCRTLKERRAGDHRLIPIGDSKKLKLANQSVRQHPLTHLERGVLCALSTAGAAPDTDDELLGLLGAELPGEPWYASEPVRLPLGTERDDLAIDANLLRQGCREAGIGFEDLACRVIGEVEFNTTIERYRTKAAVTAGAVARHIRAIVDRWGGSDAAIRIVVDRLGARASYGPILERAVPAARVRAVAESPECSAYVLDGLAADLRVLFVTESESAHLPAALASMAAKLVRELSMRRLNAHFGAERDGLKPTAGYVTDARRWLAELRPDADLRRRLVRNA